MGLERGERQTQRTQIALESAFIALIHEKSYAAITINDIISHANVGRSTFYRHFQTKADILLSLHQSVFDHFSLGLTSSADWLADEPSPQLITLLQQMQQYDGIRAAFLYQLGKDVDYVVHKIDQLLCQQFEETLRRCFSETQSSIPLPLLAQSIAGTYSWIIRTWFMEPQSLTASQVAGHIHKLTRAAIREAFVGIG